VQRAFDKLTESAILARVGSDSFEFAHPLMAEVLYDDLGPVERRRLHAAISSHVSSQPNGRMGLLERATHAVEAASPGDPVAVATALQAARATRDAAPLSAAHWLSRALDLVGDDSGQAGDILAAQTRAYWKGSRPDLAVDSGVRATELLPPGHRRTSTAITVVNAAYAMGRLAEALELSERLLPGKDASAAVFAQRSLILAHLGRTPEAGALLEVAWERVASSGPEEQAVTYTYLAILEDMIGTEEATGRALSALAALASDDRGVLPIGARLSALESRAYVLSLAGQPVQSRDALGLADSLAQSTGWQDLGGQAVLALVRSQYHEGEWSAALEGIGSGAIALDFAGLANNLAWLRVLEVDILLNQGLHTAAEEVLDGVRLPEDWGYWCAVRDVQQARIHLARHGMEGAVTTLTERLRCGIRIGWWDVVHRCIDVLVDLALECGHPDVLRSIEPELRGLDARGVLDSLRLSRVVRAAMAVLDRDPAAAAEAMAGGEADHIPMATARAQFILAWLGYDPAVNLGAAARTFDRLGARPWSKRAHALARVHGISLERARVEPATSQPVLADIELQLLQLVRDGLNNREIAETMHYSRKTVEAYLSRLYRKTGSHSRVSLIVAAERHGWLAASAARSRQ
jgi:DNA-binding CsgD family transcriptional regulator/tetratricopeptide (TPR) repeat protein